MPPSASLPAAGICARAAWTGIAEANSARVYSMYTKRDETRGNMIRLTIGLALFALSLRRAAYLERRRYTGQHWAMA